MNIALLFLAMLNCSAAEAQPFTEEEVIREAVLEAVEEERAQIAELTVSEKKAIALVEKDKAKSAAERRKAIHRIKQEHRARRNAIRLRIRQDLRSEFQRKGEGVK